MKIGLLGNSNAQDEINTIPGITTEVVVLSDISEVNSKIGEGDILLVFNKMEKEELDALTKAFSGFLGLNTIYGSTLSQIGKKNEKVFSFIGMNGFIGRKKWEIGLPFDGQKDSVLAAFNNAGIQVDIMKDRAGLASARVICMIINEAYFTVMEGTSAKKDIDVAMKLGTNYPFGPFEMVEKAGVENIYTLVESLYQENRDDRYKPCPLLREEAILSGIKKK